MTAALEGGEWSAARPGHTLPPVKTRHPFYRRLGGLQGRSGRAENLVPTGIRSRTVQPIAQSLYQLSYLAHKNNFNTNTHTSANIKKLSAYEICTLNNVLRPYKAPLSGDFFNKIPLPVHTELSSCVCTPSGLISSLQ